ncbi:MAG: cytochrome c3 family protein [Coriobacteriia bacterium]|nr:cytochrome c3 family protein [Coriobacteriia bacterium]
MESALTSLASAALKIVADPTSNLTAAVFLMAAVVLVVLIIILMAIIVMLPRGRHQQRQPESDDELEDILEVHEGVSAPAPAPARPRRGRAFAGGGSAWVIAIGLMAVFGSAYVGTAQDSFCMTCHAEVRTEVEGGTHAATACVRCHEDSLALPSNTARRVFDVAAHYGLGTSAYSTHVPSSRCYSCHKDITDAVTHNEETGVMMSHAEPLDAGYACADCHRSKMHADMTAPAGMSVCLACHDAETASAECSTCHAKDTSAASELAAERIYGIATITRRDCEGCHSMESCDACHGIRMPHPEEFLQTHPRYSGFDLKEQCFEQCHTQADCGKCHAPWNGHESDFKETHKRYAKDSSCNTCHNQHEGPMCDLCHEFDQ